MRTKLTALLATIMMVGVFAATAGPANACWFKKGWGGGAGYSQGGHAGWWGHKRGWKRGW